MCRRLEIARRREAGARIVRSVVVKKAKPLFLEKVELFDIFKGKGIPEDKKSMAYAFTYRHNERTLTEQEVNNDHQKILESLQSNLHATLR